MSLTTKHYDRVKEFMERAKQDCPDSVIIPSEEVRILRAKLILEEAFETVHAMGIEVYTEVFGDKIDPNRLSFGKNGEVDLIEVADGCADIKVVTTGTLIAFGIKDVILQEEVDVSNLAKFAGGGYRSDGTDGNAAGKWIKPPNWQKPNIQKALEV